MNLKTTFKSVFYDKTITLYSKSEQIDSEGWGKIEDIAVTGTILGNVSFNNFDKVQKDNGIQDEIDIVITTDETVANNTIIGYDSIQYLIYRVIKSDTHNMLVGKKWLSKSSISLSA